MRLIRGVISCTTLALCATAGAATPEEIFAESAARQADALQQIDSIRLVTETMGLTQLEYFEKTSAVHVNGETMYILRNVPLSEIEQRHAAGGGLADASPTDLRRAADMLEQKAPEVEREVQREMQQAGLPGGLGQMLMNPPGDQPWLSVNPRDTAAMYATMLRGTATGKEEQAARDAAALEGLREGRDVAARTQLVGETMVDGQRAFHLTAPDLNHTQVEDGVEFTLQTADIWIDAVNYVPLRMTMNGVVREGGESRPITIERHDQDYRRVQGCGDLYQPFRSVMRIAGVMTAEQEAQMREAQVQLDELEQQMQQMPQGQRDMIMRQMGPQMEMMKKMAAGGGIEVVSNVADLQCNVPVPSPHEIAQATFGSGMFAPGAGAGTGAAVESGTAVAPAAAATQDPAALQAAQQACLQEKIAAAQEANKKKRGFGRLMSAVTRTAAKMGNYDIGRTIGDVYDANATAEDLSAAAKDLGLTEDEVAACRNP